MNDVVLKLRRKRRREFKKHRKSEKYVQLDLRYREFLSKSMKSFYKNDILKNIKPKGMVSTEIYQN